MSDRTDVRKVIDKIITRARTGHGTTLSPQEVKLLAGVLNGLSQATESMERTIKTLTAGLEAQRQLDAEKRKPWQRRRR